MYEIGLELTIILLLTLVNGVFAMSEVSLLSSRKIRLQQRASEGNQSSAVALKEQLGLRELSDEEDTPYQTVAGFIIHHLQHLPKAGEYVDWKEMRFEVLDMDGPRIDKVSVTRMPAK